MFFVDYCTDQGSEIHIEWSLYLINSESISNLAAILLSWRCHSWAESSCFFNWKYWERFQFFSTAILSDLEIYLLASNNFSNTESILRMDDIQETMEPSDENKVLFFDLKVSENLEFCIFFVKTHLWHRSILLKKWKKKIDIKKITPILLDRW